MEYLKEISDKINFVNEVMNEIKVPHVLENSDFLIDEMSIESWFKVNLRDKGQNNIPLSLTFTLTGLEVRLDRIAEAIDWSNQNLKDSTTLVKSMLKNILTSNILVEYHGSFRTRISLFGQNGKVTNTFKYYNGFLLKGKKEERLYFPIYSLK